MIYSAALELNLIATSEIIFDCDEWVTLQHFIVFEIISVRKYVAIFIEVVSNLFYNHDNII